MYLKHFSYLLFKNGVDVVHTGRLRIASAVFGTVTPRTARAFSILFWFLREARSHGNDVITATGGVGRFPLQSVDMICAVSAETLWRLYWEDLRLFWLSLSLVNSSAKKEDIVAVAHEFQAQQAWWSAEWKWWSLGYYALCSGEWKGQMPMP